VGRMARFEAPDDMGRPDERTDQNGQPKDSFHLALRHQQATPVGVSWFRWWSQLTRVGHFCTKPEDSVPMRTTTPICFRGPISM